MTLAGVVLGSGGGRAGDMSLYKNVPTTRTGQQECGYEDSGIAQASCKYIEVGSLDGWLGPRQVEALKLARLEKYWNSGTYLKFAGTACGRGDSAEAARDVAMGRGKMIVKRLIESFEEENLTEELRKHASYREVNVGGSCVDTPNTREAQAPKGTSEDSDMTLEDIADAIEQDRERLRADIEREEERRREAQRARTATFILHNADRYSLGLNFYQRATGRVWPGGGKQYVLAKEGTYRLACEPGEQICLGAWRDHQTREWGVGRNDRTGCKGCCTTCGFTLEATLNDAGADSYPATNGGGGSGGGGGGGSSAVNDLANIITGVGTGIQIYNSLNGGAGGGSYSSPSPAPRGPDYRPSGISR